MNKEQYILEIVASFPNKQAAKATQDRLDRVMKSVDGTWINIAIDAVENNRDIIQECKTLAQQGKKAQMLLTLGTALVKGKIKI